MIIRQSDLSIGHYKELKLRFDTIENGKVDVEVGKYKLSALFVSIFKRPSFTINWLGWCNRHNRIIAYPEACCVTHLSYPSSLLPSVWSVEIYFILTIFIKITTVILPFDFANST